MRLMISIFVLAAVFASTSAAFAFDRAAVNVPFSFETHGETLPAGTYEVEFDWIHHTLKLSSKPTRRSPMSGSLILHKLVLINQRSH